VSIVAAAVACANSVERTAAPQMSAQSADESYSVLHAAIPESQGGGDVFEYGTVVPVTEEKVAVFDSRPFFDYN